MTHHHGQSVALKRKRVSDSCSSVGSVNGPYNGGMRWAWGNKRLCIADPDIFEIMEKEKERQCKGIVLVENFVCTAVMEALGSHLTNKYVVGNNEEKDIGGSEYMDEIETLCLQRALAAFGLDSKNWGVKSCIGTSANFAVYAGLLKPGDKIMGLDVVSGGNKSHGYEPDSSGASFFLQSLSYKVNPETGYVDYDKLEEQALDFRPNLLICGGDSYSREWDYARFRQIADKCGAMLMCDMSEISGLVAAKECASPFECCDIVTSTTHKSLRGPRGGIIFSRKCSSTHQGDDDDDDDDDDDEIDFGIQGRPNNNHIAALAVALKQVASPEYKMHMQQVKKNAQALASALLWRKCNVITGGTDNHMVLWDLRGFGLLGFVLEKVCEMCRITLCIFAPFDTKGGWSSGGARLDAAAMTSRGFVERDFQVVALFLVRAALIAATASREICDETHEQPFPEFLENNKQIIELRAEVEYFASRFAMPSFYG